MEPLYLTRLRLAVRSRDVQTDLSDCHAMHRRLLLAFPNLGGVDDARERFGILYRIESSARDTDILLQSRVAPDWSRLPQGYLSAPPHTKSIDAAYAQITDGRDFVFRLRANPTKRISARNEHEAERWHGKRVELRSEEDQIAWLRRKGTQAGFELVTVRASNVAQVQRSGLAERVGSTHGPHKLTFGSVVFEGRLRVKDVALFRQALEDGIGSGKAFGFGLLSIAAVPRD